MSPLVIIRIALRSLRRTGLRSSLTALGIIIGVAAVIALLSIGNGAKAKVDETMRGLDTNYVVMAAAVRRDPANPGAMQPPPPGQGLNLEDYFAARRSLSAHASVNLQVYAIDPWPALIKARGRSNEADLSGTDALSEGDLDGLKLVRGASISEADVKAARTVCVITQTLANNLFSSEDVLGKRVTIGGVPFTIAGVLRDQNMGAGGADGQARQDTRAIIPYTSFIRRLNRNAVQAMLILVKPDDPAQLVHVQQQLSDLIERRRGTRKSEFLTGNMAQITKTYQDNARTLSLLLASIGAISLFVGGIGIMNIMLVSVTERTREIGIRLAIGTRDRDVLRQFLVEAVLLSVLGGFIGIALGVVASKVIGTLGGLATQVSATSIIGAFLCSAAIGIFFGWYPARRAARLDPIEALRAE